jgi:hypothetical protein
MSRRAVVISRNGGPRELVLYHSLDHFREPGVAVRKGDASVVLMTRRELARVAAPAFFLLAISVHVPAQQATVLPTRIYQPRCKRSLHLAQGTNQHQMNAPSRTFIGAVALSWLETLFGYNGDQGA